MGSLSDRANADFNVSILKPEGVPLNLSTVNAKMYEYVLYSSQGLLINVVVLTLSKFVCKRTERE